METPEEKDDSRIWLPEGERGAAGSDDGDRDADIDDHGPGPNDWAVAGDEAETEQRATLPEDWVPGALSRPPAEAREAGSGSAPRLRVVRPDGEAGTGDDADAPQPSIRQTAPADEAHGSLLEQVEQAQASLRDAESRVREAERRAREATEAARVAARLSSESGTAANAAQAAGTAEEADQRSLKAEEMARVADQRSRDAVDWGLRLERELLKLTEGIAAQQASLARQLEQVTRDSAQRQLIADRADAAESRLKDLRERLSRFRRPLGRSRD